MLYAIGIVLVLGLCYGLCSIGVMVYKAIDRIDRLDMKLSEHFRGHNEAKVEPTYHIITGHWHEGHLGDLRVENKEIRRGEG